MGQVLAHSGEQSAPPHLAPVVDTIEQTPIVTEEIDLTALPEGLEALCDSVQFHLGFSRQRRPASAFY
jgi:hypothetical protein